MSERIEIKDPQWPFVGILPCDIRMARQGAADFEKVVAALPENLRAGILDSLDVQSCFTGVCPEVGGSKNTPFLNHLSLEDKGVLAITLSQHAPNVTIVESNDRYYLSMINLAAAQRVVDNHQKYFPKDAVGNLKRWLKEKQDRWRTGSNTYTNNIRYGLLSGFPLSSVVRYADNDLLSRKPPKFMSRKERVYLGELKSKRAANAFLHGVSGYIGYHKEGDGAYIDRINTLFDQSGILQVVEKFRQASQ